MYYADYVCTSRVVAPCSVDKIECRGFQDSIIQSQFEELFPDVYAQTCEEPNGELCFYTDIAYGACAVKLKVHYAGIADVKGGPRFEGK